MSPRVKLRAICSEYHKAIAKVTKKDTFHTLMNDTLLEKVKDKICIAEARILEAMYY